MELRQAISELPEIAVRIRVRGMSQEHRYFDEETTTSRLTQDFIVIRLRNLVELDSELYITNMRTLVGGAYRVVWLNSRAGQGFYSVGLELLDTEGEIWQPELIPHGLLAGATLPTVLLACQRCNQRVSIPVPEAETGSLSEGFVIARHCDTCKATTAWAYTVEELAAPEPPPPQETAPASEAAASTAATRQEQGGFEGERRLKARVLMKLPIKIVRTVYGLPIEDICETTNVSRTGLYFATEQGYEVGEIVQVIMPYHKDSTPIPVRGRVVRQEERQGSSQKRVAIHLIS